MTAPKPHDPRELRVTPEDVTQQYEAALQDAPSAETTELSQLEAAYAVLARALQDGAK